MPPTADPVNLECVPDYALKYAPIVWLHKGDEFFPSHVEEHLQHVNPRTFAGADVDVPTDIKNKVKVLAHPDVNKGDVFLTLDVRTSRSTRLDVSSESAPGRSNVQYNLYPCLCSFLSMLRLMKILRKTSERTQRYPSCRPRTASRIATEGHTRPVS